MTTRVTISSQNDQTDDAPESGVKAHEHFATATETNAPKGTFGPLSASVQLADAPDITALVKSAGVKGFATEQDMSDAISATNENGESRMLVDPVYRAAVEARIAGAMGRGSALHQHVSFKGEAQDAPLRVPTKDPLQIDVGQFDAPAAVPFASSDDMVEAMADPRYRRNETYRRMVDARIVATP